MEELVGSAPGTVQMIIRKKDGAIFLRLSQCLAQMIGTIPIVGCGQKWINTIGARSGSGSREDRMMANTFIFWLCRGIWWLGLTWAATVLLMIAYAVFIA